MRQTGAGGSAARQGMDGGSAGGPSGFGERSGTLPGPCVDDRAGGCRGVWLSGKPGAAFPTSGQPHEWGEGGDPQLAGMGVLSPCRADSAAVRVSTGRRANRPRGAVDSRSRARAGGGRGIRLAGRGGTCETVDPGLKKRRGRGISGNQPLRPGFDLRIPPSL